MKKLLRAGFLVVISISIFALQPGSARQGQYGGPQMMSGPPVDMHDISGFWDLSVDSRQVPLATLLPTITKAAIEQHEKADEKAIRWCDLLGLTYMMDPGRPIDIQQGTREIVIFAEVPASPRHIYLDRTKHIDKDIFDPTTNGDSIAHWDGDALVVDTIGFHPTRGITSIPGGGFRTADTHLVERYQMLENGAVLSVKFTWTDPKVYKTPHSYEFHYYRVAGKYEPPAGLACNPYDDVRTKFLGFTPPPAVAPSNVPGAR